MAHDRDRADQPSLPETWDAIVRGEHPPAAGQPAGRIELLRLIQAHGELRQSHEACTSYMPRAHIEQSAKGRAQLIGPREHAYHAMIQLQYTL